MNQDFIADLRSATERIAPVPDREWNYLVSNIEYRSYSKEAFIIRSGEFNDRVYTILRGITRTFYATEDGREFNKYFATEYMTVGSFSSILLGQPSRFNVQALENTEVASLSKAFVDRLYERHPCWERLGRINAEHVLLFKETREKELILDSLETRYLTFMTEYPGLSGRIPQYHIASYLGVTPVALSRMKGRLKKNQG